MGAPYGGRAHFTGLGVLNQTSGVTASLPAGAVLGAERWEDGIKWRLFYNAGGASMATGNGFTRGGGAGPYSVTVTTVAHAGKPGIAGCIPGGHGKTITTGTYFWGAVRGDVGKLLVSNVSIATGALIAAGANGAFAIATITHPVGVNLGNSNGTGTTDAVSGDFFVNYE